MSQSLAVASYQFQVSLQDLFPQTLYMDVRRSVECAFSNRLPGTT